MEIITLKNNGYITNICEYLYLGDKECSQNYEILNNHKISNIINLSNSKEYIKYDSIKYNDIEIEDNKEVKIINYFEECINLIKDSILQKKNILVHCMNGVSRSVTIIIVYLINEGYSLEEALIYVKKNREQQYTQPNIGFFKQLLEFEKIKHKKNSISLKDYIKFIKNK